MFSQPAQEFLKFGIETVRSDALEFSRGELSCGVVECILHVDPRILCVGVSQRPDVSVIQSDQGINHFIEVSVLGDPADHMHIRSHESIFDFAEVLVQRYDVWFEPFRTRIFGYVQVVEHVMLFRTQIDLVDQFLFALGRGVAFQGEVILQRNLHLRQFFVLTGTCHRRRHMAQQYGVDPSLALDSLSGVVHHVIVKVGKSAEDHIGIAFGGHSHVLAGEPLDSSVGAHMDHHVGLEHVADPSVVGEILVLCEDDRVMDVLLHLLGGAPEGLVTDEHVAFLYAGDDDIVPVHADRSGAVSPILSHLFLVPGGYGFELFPVCARRYEIHRFLSHGGDRHAVEVIGDAVEDLLYHLPAVLRDVIDGVPLLFEFLQEPGYALGGVESRRVADASGVGT